MNDVQIFIQIGMMIVLATIGGIAAKILKQPLIPAYILTGIVLGPWLGIITNSDVIRTLSLTGIAFLLFIVGLELNFRKLGDIGYIATIGGLIQVLLVFAAGFIAGNFFGLSNTESAYLGIIAALSSTMVVVKLLSDKRELNTLHGKIIIGILLMQDIIAIFVLSAITSINSFALGVFAVSALKALVVIAMAYLGAKYIFPSLFRFAAYSQELLFLAALSICFFFSILFSYIGFSIAVGGFVAGISLANLPYNIEIESKVKSLRDFFATLFFVSLGMELNFGSISGIMPLLVVLLLIVVLLKPAVVMLISAFFGYTKRTSFLSAISLAQVSEFSFIIAAMGLAAGQISGQIFTITILLAVVTIILTSYFINFDNKIYAFLKKPLDIFDIKKRGSHLEYLPDDGIKKEVILVGYDRIGYSIFKTMEKMRKTFIVIDFNPDIIKKLIARKIPCLYGDIGDPEIIERLDLKSAQLIVSTIPTLEDNLLIIRKTKNASHKAVIFVTAETINDAMALYNNGADYVILPHFLGGEMVSTIIEEYSHDLKKIIKNKLLHIDELKRRLSMEHEHPKKHNN